MSSQSRQGMIIRVRSEVARAARAFLAESGQAYADFDELVEVALMNQLNIERHRVEVLERRGGVRAPHRASSGDAPGAGGEESDGSSRGAIPPVASRVGNWPNLESVIAEGPKDEALFVMTNRISPIKVAARALATLAAEQGTWPTVNDFHDRASALARQIGLRLRADGSRRWVGYPVGADAGKARQRFITSFAVLAPHGRLRGPMALLGLVGLAPTAAVTQGARRTLLTRSTQRIGLTEVGLEIARLPSPIFGECEGNTLSAAEAEMFTRQLLAIPAEEALIRDFLGMVRRAAGVQSRVDELMSAKAPGRSEKLLIAERAALIGRLADLHLIDHHGRGTESRIAITIAGRDLLSKIRYQDRRTTD